jgi:hypothetical protein
MTFRVWTQRRETGVHINNALVDAVCLSKDELQQQSETFGSNGPDVVSLIRFDLNTGELRRGIGRNDSSVIAESR